MSETFKFVGVSRHPNGEFKVRYANDAGRVRVLARNGHTSIHFIELEQPELKIECMDALMDWAEANADTLSPEVYTAVILEAEAQGFDLAHC